MNPWPSLENLPCYLLSHGYFEIDFKNFTANLWRSRPSNPRIPEHTDLVFLLKNSRSDHSLPENKRPASLYSFL
jgi:hypothetical protein